MSIQGTENSQNDLFKKKKKSLSIHFERQRAYTPVQKSKHERVWVGKSVSRGGAEGEGEGASQAGSMLSVQIATRGSISQTMRSWPELKSRAGHLTNWATRVLQNDFDTEQQNGKTHTPWFQNLLQNYSNHGVVLAKEQTCKLMEQNWQSRNKSSHLWPTDFQQGCQHHSTWED